MLKGNYIDLIIILVLVYFATEAWRHGFWVILIAFILTLAIAFPLNPGVKADIVRSRLGGVILAKTVGDV